MHSQKQFLVAVKKGLEDRGGRLTWDRLADLAGIEPRALKTYRMPESSADYRQMPPVVRQAFEALLAQPVRSDERTSAVLMPALAWLVVSQARISVIENQMVLGIDRRRGTRNGLSEEERKVMALVSRHSLANGLPDRGGEIHALLASCTRPLEAWLGIPDIMRAGYGPTVLIDPESLIPTPEAEELAAQFSTISARIEEELFDKLREALDRFPAESADRYYTAIREFIIRNPVASVDKLFEYGKVIPSVLWMAVQHDYYEPIPQALATNGNVTLCAHCGSLMKPDSGGRLRCYSASCAAVHPATPGPVVPAADQRRVSRGIHQYWVVPGIDEIRLYDKLVSAGMDVGLYPHRDRVDLAVGSVGIDLKSYASPEILGARFRKGLGGLSFYEEKWVVIPEWRLAASPDYLERLIGAMGDVAGRVRCLSQEDAARALLKNARRRTP
jgi:hypothetical protein